MEKGTLLFNTAQHTGIRVSLLVQGSKLGIGGTLPTRGKREANVHSRCLILQKLGLRGRAHAV